MATSPIPKPSKYLVFCEDDVDKHKPLHDVVLNSFASLADAQQVAQDAANEHKRPMMVFTLESVFKPQPVKADPIELVKPTH